MKPGSSYELFAKLYASTTIAAIKWWILNGTSYSKEELIHLIEQVKNFSMYDMLVK